MFPKDWSKMTFCAGWNTEGIPFDPKPSSVGAWSVATWTPRNPCYFSAIFPRHSRPMALSLSQGEFGPLKKNVTFQCSFCYRARILYILKKQLFALKYTLKHSLIKIISTPTCFGLIRPSSGRCRAELLSYLEQLTFVLRWLCSSMQLDQVMCPLSLLTCLLRGPVLAPPSSPRNRHFKYTLKHSLIKIN